MRRTVLLLAVLASSLFLNAQFVIDWQQCYGGENNDKAYGIIEMDDGFLVSGISRSPNSGMVECDFGNYVGGGWLIKINQNHDLEWGKCYTTSSIQIYRYASDSPIYTVGGGLFPETGKSGLGIRRIDENGNTIWERVVGNPNYDFTYGVGAIATSDGGVLGYAKPCHSGGDISHWYGGYDGWLVKLDSLSNSEWEVTLGTDETDMVYGLCETSDEGFLAFMRSTAGAQPGSIEPCKPVTNWHDAVLVKLSNDGRIEWNRCYGGTASDQFNIGIEIDDGYLLAGASASDDGDLENAGYHLGYVGVQQRAPDIWLLRLDYDGNIIWSRCFGGSGIETPFRVFQNEDGGFTVFAHSESRNGDVQSASHWVLPPGMGEAGNWWIFRTDSEGNLLWERALGSRSGSREELFDVVKHNDREYTVAGYSANWDEFNYIYHGDFECTNNFLCGTPGNAVYWIVHIRDVFDYDAVDENTKEDMGCFEVFPIPAKELFTIRGGEDAFHYSMINAIGQEVIQGVAQSEQQISVSGMNKGIYFIRLTDGIHTCVKKIVLE